MVKTFPFNPFTQVEWQLAGGRSLTLGKKSRIMGILNVTPDSFSDGGKHINVEKAVAHAYEMIDQGADIIDIGGESSRPGATPVEGEIERKRILPVIEKLANNKDILISVDTYRPKTAKAALSAGAHIINDVWGLQKQPKIAGIIAKYNAGVCLMHNGRERKILPDTIEDQINYFSRSLKICEEYGIKQHSVVLDPGYGFAKETELANTELLARMAELFIFKLPVMTGTSRKRFLGSITGLPVHLRDAATAASNVVARTQGSTVFRVHNVAINRQALQVSDSILQAAFNCLQDKKNI